MADKFRIIHLSGDNAEEKAQTLLNGGTIETPDGGTGIMGENDVVTIPDKTDERLDNHETRISAVESAVGGIADGVIRNLATGEEFKFFIGPNEEWTAYTGDKTNVLFFPTDEKSLYEHEVSIKLSNTTAGYALSAVGTAYVTLKFKSEKSGYTSYSDFITDFLAWAKERSVNSTDGYYFDASGFFYSESTTAGGYYAVTNARYEMLPSTFVVSVYALNSAHGQACVYLYEDTATVDAFHCHSVKIR